MLPVLMLALVAFIHPKVDITGELKSHLERWRNNYSPEKVYLHHDKPYYAPGQQLWLKGYVMDAASLHPSSKSNILYVDLLDSENQPVHSLKLQVENGKTNGDLILPDDLAEGTYRLSAYTQWMRNFGEDSFFNKEIRIISDTEGMETASIFPGEIDLQFFPEGGNMVYGLNNQVAFKAIGTDGKGVAIAGAIFDEEGRKILDFEDHHLGMGAFILQPEQALDYFAKVNFNDGTTVDYPLPQAKETGYVLNINDQVDNNYLEVNITGNVQEEELLVITGISRDELKFSENVTVQAGKLYHQQIDKKQFPTGIARFNLARANGEPLAERLVFIDNQDDLNITITTNKDQYRSREQVTMQVEAKDGQGNPVATDFSLAVTDDELVIPDNYGLNIKNYLLLTSDLKGYVENPDYYFETKDIDRAVSLDYLLMTQGWRGFTWKEAIDGEFPDIQFRNESDLSIKGRLETNKGEPVKNGEVILYLKDQHQTFIVTETNRDGYFSFEGFNFTDTIDIVVQGSDSRGRRKHLQVKMDDEQYVPQPLQRPVPGSDELTASANRDFLAVSQNQIASIEAENKALTLGELVLKDVVIQGRAKIISPVTSLHRRADAVFSSEELPVAPSGNILESLQGRVAGVQIIRTGPNEFRANIRGRGTPLYLLDGMPIHESTLTALNQFDIGRIEIIRNLADAGIYGGRASGGVIALYTKRGGEELVEVEPGTYIITHRAGGFSKVREFYSPRYSNEGEGSDLPDLRITLYWNPSVKTNDDGRATVSFYTADRNTTYRAIMEGISDDGKPGRGVMTFTVKHEDVTP